MPALGSIFTHVSDAEEEEEETVEEEEEEVGRSIFQSPRSKIIIINQPDAPRKHLRTHRIIDELSQTHHPLLPRRITFTL